MATVLKVQKRTIILENITHVQVFPDATLLFPAGFYTLRLTGEDAVKAFELAKQAGFVGNDYLLVNPSRLVVAEEENATARLMMDGQAKQILIPVEFLAHLEPTPAPIPAVVNSEAFSRAGKTETATVSRKKKSANETERFA